jgi:GT2 family glycosyltransferase
MPARQPRPAGRRVAAVVVNHSHHATLPDAVRSLARQTAPVAEVVVVEHDAARRGVAALAAAGIAATVVLPTANTGFAGGCNAGATAAGPADWLLFLNPDAEAEPDCVAQLLAVADAHPGAGALGAQVLLPDGRTNAGANGAHASGLSWAGRLGEAAESGPDRPALALSGAALLVRRDVFDALGGFCARYFTYHEDLELCWRTRLAGHDVRFCPRARVRHEYAFGDKPGKWRYLERNRAWVVLSAYEARTLVALLPVLAATEAGVLLAAVRGGWWREKAAAYRELWAARAWLAGRRRAVQRTRVAGDAAILPLLDRRIATPVLDGPAVRLANPLLAAYLAVVTRALAGDAAADPERAAAEPGGRPG